MCVCVGMNTHPTGSLSLENSDILPEWGFSTGVCVSLDFCFRDGHITDFTKG